MKSILKDSSFQTAFILTFIFLLAGFSALHQGYANYGVWIFLGLPVAIGVCIGALPSLKAASIGFIICVFIFLLGLTTLGLEGYVCVLMVLPVIVPPMFLASVVTHLTKRYIKIRESEKLPVIIFPLFIFLIGIPVERSVTNNVKVVNEVSSQIVLPYPSIEIYNRIKSVDTLIAEKSWLMVLGLPVPEKCILDKEEVGGIRTCFFSGGKIVERITELKPGKALAMDVIDYQLTGRKWLGFQRAVYRFDSVSTNACRLTRITTYTSELKPRFYWAPLERMAVEQEHTYVFDNLVRQLNSTNRNTIQQQH